MAAAQRPQPLPEEVPGPEVQAAGVALHLPNGSWPCIGPPELPRARRMAMQSRWFSLAPLR
jgi:hypothetical protein